MNPMNVTQDAVNVVCAAGSFCQCKGQPLDLKKHLCRECKKPLHGGPCSNGDTEDMNNMLCIRCDKIAKYTNKDNVLEKYGAQFTGDGKLKQPVAPVAIMDGPPSHQTSQVTE